MKKRIAAFALMLILLTVCLTACEWELKVDDPTMLELPGIKWAATLENVKKSLKLSEEQILADTEYGKEYRLMFAGVPFFGEEVSLADFRFAKLSDGKYALARVYLFYPDNTDMTVIRDSLIGVYGPGTEMLGVATYPISSQGMVVPEVDSIVTLSPKAGISVMANWWASTAKGTEVYTGEMQKSIIDVYVNPNRVVPVSRDIVLEHLEKNPLVKMVCTDSFNNKVYENAEYFTRNVVYFTAYDHITNLYLSEK